MKKYLSKIFCIYTLIVPLFYSLFILNEKYGVACGDGCHTHSYFIYFVLLLLFCIAGLLNIFFFLLARKGLIKKRVCLFALIFNCLYLGYGFLGTINVWYLIVLGPLEIITIPIQFVLIWYVFLKELHLKERPLIYSISLGILSFMIFLFFLFKYN